MIRISTLISFGLIVGMCMSWAAFLKFSHDKYALWRYGKTAVVLAIDDYVTTAVNKQGAKNARNYYVANLKAQLSSGEVVNIPRKPVTLEQINASHQKQLGIVFVPHSLETNHFVGEEPQLLRLLLMSCAISAASVLWFRRRSE